MPPSLAEAGLGTEPKRVALDDGLVGAQTVVGDHEAPLLMEWSVTGLRAELAEPCPGFVLLMGSRYAERGRAGAIVRDVCRNLSAAAGVRPLSIVSRWHHTLQGHFPLETDVINDVFGPFDATVLVPPLDGESRLTVNDIHYVVRGDVLVPAAEAIWPEVEAIGFRSSNLRDWVQERTGGRLRAEAVESITLYQLRRGGPAVVAEVLLNQPRGAVCIVNAAALRDLEVFAAALHAAEAEGRRFLIHAGAPFEAVRWGLCPRNFLTVAELELVPPRIRRGPPTSLAHRDYSPPEAPRPAASPHRKMTPIPESPRAVPSRFDSCPASVPGGLVVIGSRHPRTVAQIDCLLSGGGILPLEVLAARLLTSRRDEAMARMSSALNAALTAGQDVAVFASQRAEDVQTQEAGLLVERVSKALVELVRTLEVRPRYILVKGGSTASELARDALLARRALLVGRLTADAPVWRLGMASRFPGLPYVVVPGSAGGPEALSQLVRRLGNPTVLPRA